MCEPKTIKEYGGSYDDKKNKETLREIKKNLEKDLKFSKFNDWYKNASRRIRKEARLLSVPLTEKEKEHIRKQYKRSKEDPEDWEETPYEPYMGCNIRCGDCHSCEKKWKFGERCRYCRKKIRNLVTTCMDIFNNSYALTCNDCAIERGRKGKSGQKKDKKRKEDDSN